MGTPMITPAQLATPAVVPGDDSFTHAAQLPQTPVESAAQQPRLGDPISFPGANPPKNEQPQSMEIVNVITNLYRQHHDWLTLLMMVILCILLKELVLAAGGSIPLIDMPQRLQKLMHWLWS
ncbi:hypothetical protein TWF481_006215 [Arthrobotrys musiformis]|uniref:Uncharacterized protein n=1 Tax=Arthrobotrys musiformis TaxID=47236 RepID=A0AAV9WLR9_9PEZI